MNCPGPISPRPISVVIPALNEAEALPDTLAHARRIPEVGEVIVVDGGSTDCTREVSESGGCRVLSTRPGRGGQLRTGAQQAGGDVLVFLHADTWLPENAGRTLLDCLRHPGVVGGGFWKVFREPKWLMRGSRFKCGLRIGLLQLVLGDQAMFVRRDVLERVGGVPDVALMEEFELCRALRKVGRLKLADATVSTSARRFHKHGALRTYSMMLRLMFAYYRGASPDELARLYLPHSNSRPQ